MSVGGRKQNPWSARLQGLADKADLGCCLLSRIPFVTSFYSQLVHDTNRIESARGFVHASTPGCIDECASTISMLTVLH